MAWYREYEKVWIRKAQVGPLYYRQDDPVACIKAVTIVPVCKVTVIGLQLGILEDFKIFVHSMHDSDFQAVLQVFADATQGNVYLNVVPRQLLIRPDSGKHQQLRCVEGAASQNNFVPGTDPPRNGVCCRLVGKGVGTIEMFTVKEFHANGAITFQQNARCQRMQLHCQTIGHTPFDLIDELARTDTDSIFNC